MRREVNTDKLKNLIGKTIKNIHLHTAHGDVLEITFNNNTTLGVCTTHEIMDKTVLDDPNDLYITLDDVSCFKLTES